MFRRFLRLLPVCFLTLTTRSSIKMGGIIWPVPLFLIENPFVVVAMFVLFEFELQFSMTYSNFFWLVILCFLGETAEESV